MLIKLLVILFTEIFICSEVHKAQERSSGRYVALKKVRMENEKEGFPMTALREIRILQLLKHENVMELIEICRSRGTKHITCVLIIVIL